MKAKYVCGSVLTEWGSSVTVAILFPEILSHFDVAKSMQMFPVLGAGFYDVSGSDEHIFVDVYGESSSLGSESREEDIEFIKTALGLREY